MVVAVVVVVAGLEAGIVVAFLLDCANVALAVSVMIAAMARQ
jgi:MFS superfamily sulfate permease-like transporter